MAHSTSRRAIDSALARSSSSGSSTAAASAASTSAAYASSWSSRAVIAVEQLVVVGEGEDAGQRRAAPRRRPAAAAATAAASPRAASAASRPSSSSARVGVGRVGGRLTMPTMPHMEDQATDGDAADPGSAARISRRPGPRPRSISAPASAWSWVGASTITRTSGSVPLGRTSTRPRLPSSASTLAISSANALGGVGHRRGDGHVDEDLRQPGHRRRRQLGQRPPRPAHGVTQDHAGQQAVTGRGHVAEDHVAALLTAQRVRAGGQRLQHVAVADGRHHHVDAGLLHRQAEPEVRHHGDDDGVVGAGRPGRACRARRWRSGGRRRRAPRCGRRPAAGRRRRRGPARGRRRARRRRRPATPCRWPRSRR